MVLEMIKRYIKSIIYSVILLGLLGVPLSVAAQQELTREERIKILEQLKMEDKKIEVNTLGLISPKTSIDIEKLELPPLSVFLDAVTENASVKRAQSQVEQLKNQYRLEKRNWWNYFRLNGNYSYGRYNIIGNASDEYTPMYQTTMSSAQHNFNVGASVGIRRLVQPTTETERLPLSDRAIAVHAGRSYGGAKAKSSGSLQCGYRATGYHKGQSGNGCIV